MSRALVPLRDVEDYGYSRMSLSPTAYNYRKKHGENPCWYVRSGNCSYIDINNLNETNERYSSMKRDMSSMVMDMLEHGMFKSELAIARYMAEIDECSVGKWQMFINRDIHRINDNKVYSIAKEMLRKHGVLRNVYEDLFLPTKGES